MLTGNIMAPKNNAQNDSNDLIVNYFPHIIILLQFHEIEKLGNDPSKPN